MIVCSLPKTFVLRDPVSNYVTGTMTIHNEEHTVDVHVRSGVYSSDTIFDYQHVSKSKNLPWINPWGNLKSEIILVYPHILSWNTVSLRTPSTFSLPWPSPFFTCTMGQFKGLVMKPVVAVTGSEKKVPDLSGAGGEDGLPALMGSRSQSEMMLPVSGTGTRTGWFHSPKETKEMQ